MSLLFEACEDAEKRDPSDTVDGDGLSSEHSFSSLKRFNESSFLVIRHTSDRKQITNADFLLVLDIFDIFLLS